ncbi:MATE family efflux transporter [Clostridium botulinum]|uniref:MATE family efflux transporter n=1 Tax=Clostridium botulinum TaxID=1491 RepID=A0A6B4JQW0_CLOBO|nr:MATE family efflux transporter [Clostridium botulinum]EES50607.1 mate efflux family protein [Clostridium botulinum E1 str. 'BoNT E Beluga']MBY6761200.1 MATE family efflux transporter [Clostridium botulinum]MBY6921322.1 MATE family efflux transporter [Clostridium botulinum]MCR1132115.1 MATE family efflux transporter [Clostridium botulinum]NFJ59329.1 MATE family efflux transporter [Clostridium botulinum]
MTITKQLTNIVEDKVFLRKTIAIAIPVTIQALLNTTLNLIDTMMIGQLGETTIAAVGLANKVFFVFTLLLFGIVSGSSILTAQYWGKKDIKNIRKVLGISLIIGLFGAIIFVVPSLICPNLVMRIFTPNESTIGIGVAYLSIVALSYPLTAITNAYISLLRAVNEVKAPVVISLFSILINAILNYTLIFGHFGFPALGVQGAAIGTLIARIIECISVLSIVYLKNGPAAARLKELVAFDKTFIKMFFITVSPVIANEFMWGLGVTIYSLVYGRMGDGAVAAITITQTVEQIAVVIFQGISAATAVILGNELGANKLKKADVHAKYLLILQFIATLVIGVICILMRWPLIHLFTVTEAVAVDISKCLIVFVLYLPFKMFNLVNITGVLRSGGDTKSGLILDTTGVWLIGIPLAYLGGIFLSLPIYWVYVLVLAEEIYKFVLSFKRYKQKKWLKNIVEV